MDVREGWIPVKVTSRWLWIFEHETGRYAAWGQLEDDGVRTWRIVEENAPHQTILRGQYSSMESAMIAAEQLMEESAAHA
ncbi:MAG: hypothetical protein AMXMBFR13_14380 [Phycisphaerae bacterium]